MLRTLIVIAILTESIAPALSQEHPVFTMSGVIRGGLAIPQASLVSGFHDIEQGYSLPNVGYTIGGYVHLGSDNLPLSLTVGGSLTSFANGGIDGNGPTMGSTKIVLSTSMQIVSFEVGVKYQPFEIGMLNPYLGGNGSLSFIRGDLRSEANPTASHLEMNVATRFGIGLAVGTDISISGLPFAFDMQAKYLMANLVGKVYRDMSSGLDLSDGQPPFPGEAKRIDFTTFTLGLLYKIF